MVYLVCNVACDMLHVYIHRVIHVSGINSDSCNPSYGYDVMKFKVKKVFHPTALPWSVSNRYKITDKSLPTSNITGNKYLSENWTKQAGNKIKVCGQTRGQRNSTYIMHFFFNLEILLTYHCSFVSVWKYKLDHFEVWNCRNRILKLSFQENHSNNNFNNSKVK